MTNRKFRIASKQTAPFRVVFVDENTLPSGVSNAFKGEFLQTALVYGDTPTLYVGTGTDTLGPMEIKELGGKIAKTLKAEEIFHFAVDPGTVTADDAYYTNLTQGIALGSYTYSLKSDQKEPDVWEIELLGQGEDAEKAMSQGRVLAEGTFFARDMINAPANYLRPADFAEEIKNLVTPHGVEVEILSGDQLKEKGLMGIYSVGHSSEFPPQMVIMRYQGGQGEKTALVGKGITFDTGGYSLKPAQYMTTMEGDMAGAAAVAGSVYALAKNKVKANVVGIVALAENRISSGSLVPGDVYTAYDGQTVEVLNTDAEGRLVLSDAVAYAVADEKADRVLDIATLTGAVVRALGFGVTGVVTNDQGIWDDLESAASQSGERFWNFPTHKEYHKMLDSKVADMKNVGGAEGGSITAGLFIGKFVQDKPWIHLDIAGTSWLEKPLFAHQVEGGNGTGVDTMYYFVNDQAL